MSKQHTFVVPGLGVKNGRVDVASKTEAGSFQTGREKSAQGR